MQPVAQQETNKEKRKLSKSLHRLSPAFIHNFNNSKDLLIVLFEPLLLCHKLSSPLFRALRPRPPLSSPPISHNELEYTVEGSWLGYF